MGILIIEELFIGPTNTFVVSSYLSLWGAVATFITTLFQYKSATYELDKKRAELIFSDEEFPYSTFYKMLGVISLEIAIGINVIVIFAYTVFVVPNGGQLLYRASSLEATFGYDNVLTQIYFWLRNPILHTFPFLCSVGSLLMSEVILFESDWWLHIMTVLIYLIMNYAVSEFTG